MENNRALIPTNEPDVCTSHISDEAFPDAHYDTGSTRSKRGLSLQTFLIIVLLVMQLMSGLQMHQYKQYAEVVEQEAYVLSVSITLLEDCLLMEYGIYPEDYYFFDENIYYLRDAWISDANYETAHEYYEALSYLYEFFQGDVEPIEDMELIFV